MYDKKKRNLIDNCNICGLSTFLSWDHVPPQGGIEITAVEKRSIMKILEGNPNSTREISQNGVKFRTICSSCNSKIGAEYDPTLNELNKAMSMILKTSLFLPKTIKIKTKPVRLLRALLSHFLSIRNNYDKTGNWKKIRKYLKSQSEPLSQDIKLYYFIYPYDSTMIMSDFMVSPMPINSERLSMSSMIKYFPLAFILGKSPKFEHLPTLTQYSHLPLDFEIEIPINLRKAEHIDFPIEFNDHDLLFLTNNQKNNIIATKKKKRNQSK